MTCDLPNYSTSLSSQCLPLLHLLSISYFFVDDYIIADHCLPMLLCISSKKIDWPTLFVDTYSLWLTHYILMFFLIIFCRSYHDTRGYMIYYHILTLLFLAILVVSIYVANIVSHQHYFFEGCSANYFSAKVHFFLYCLIISWCLVSYFLICFVLPWLMVV